MVKKSSQDIVNTIRNFVELECKKPTSKYGYDPFPFHFVPMVNYALSLADKLKADKETVLLAAWLHDIGSIIHGRENHHVTGAQIAEEKLQELGYPQSKIEHIIKCIINHRGSLNNKRVSIEEQIIAEADAMANFDNVAGPFKVAFVFEGLSQGEAMKSVRQKLQNKWDQLELDESKEMVRPKYEAAMLLLQDIIPE